MIVRLSDSSYWPVLAFSVLQFNNYEFNFQKSLSRKAVNSSLAGNQLESLLEGVVLYGHGETWHRR